MAARETTTPRTIEALEHDEAKRTNVPTAEATSACVMPRRPAGVTALGCFFAFGALVSGLAAFLLVAPGGPLDPIWRVNPRAHEGLASLGVLGPLAMAAVCIACAASSCGFFAGRRWGLRLGVTLLVVNLFADLVNAGLRMDPRTLVGVPVVALLLWYLSGRKVRSFFSPGIRSAA